MTHEADDVLGEELVRRIRGWLEVRRDLSQQEASGDYPRPGEWHDSDDEAAYIVDSIAALFNIVEGR